LVDLTQTSQNQSNALNAMQDVLAQFNDRLEGLGATVASTQTDILDHHNHVFEHVSVVYHKLVERIDGQQEIRARLEARARAIEDQIAAIKASTSWRVTAPLRAVRLLPKLFRSRILRREFQRQVLSLKSAATRDIDADVQLRSAITGIGSDTSVPQASELLERQIFLRDLNAALSRRRSRAPDKT
jgi:hypothetical protein